MAERPGPALLRARWYDGRSARPQPVLVSLRRGTGGPTLALHPLAAGIPAPPALSHREVNWPEAWNPRRPPPTLVVDLRAAGSLEIDDLDLWQAALAEAGGRPTLAQRMQTRWSAFLGVALLAMLALVAFYRWGTPWAATRLAGAVPLSWEQRMSEDALSQLDGAYLRASRLPAERQAALRERFRALAARADDATLARYDGYRPVMTLSFRRGMGANAFALPGGTIVMTDGLVEQAAKAGLGDDALLGVLAHEMGHVVHRHGTRMVLEQGVLNLGLGLALGDVSSLIAAGSTLVTSLAYSRAHETEADCYAVALMQRTGLSPAPMADLLMHIDRPPDAQSGERRASRSGPDWLSSHPETPERARRMKQGLACQPVD